MIVDGVGNIADQLLYFIFLELSLNLICLTARWKLILVNYILASILLMES